jgi:hypothetical protein
MLATRTRTFTGGLTADGRKPPVAIRTEGARAGKDAGSAFAGTLARGLPPGG